jgi:hypothetical protein
VLSISYTSVFGPMGTREHAALQERARALEENLRALERINRELTEELRSLSSDPETVALLARDLGYYRQGDRRLVVTGLPQRQTSRQVGALVVTRDQDDQGEGGLRLALFFAPFALWVLARAAAGMTGHGGAARRR